MNATFPSDQRTLGWYRERLGKITGSCAGDLIARGKGAEFTKTGLPYLNAIAAERIIPDYIVNDDDLFAGYLEETSVSSKSMRIGSEREAEARDLYCTLTGRTVTETGSLPHPRLAYFASSPDGLVGEDSIEGAIEIKCPKPATYLEYLAGVHSPAHLLRHNPTYYWQCISHMAVTGAQWCDFIVYCPYLARPMHIVRIPRDNEAIALLEERVREAISVVDRLVGTALTPQQPARFESSTPQNSNNDMQKIGSVSLSDADFDFLVDALPRLMAHYPAASGDTDACNFIRRLKLLTDKLEKKRSSQTPKNNNRK